jgi:hypothetical protein
MITQVWGLCNNFEKLSVQYNKNKNLEMKSSLPLFISDHLTKLAAQEIVLLGCKWNLPMSVLSCRCFVISLLEWLLDQHITFKQH